MLVKLVTPSLVKLFAFTSNLFFNASLTLVSVTNLLVGVLRSDPSLNLLVNLSNDVLSKLEPSLSNLLDKSSVAWLFNSCLMLLT